MRWLHVDVDSQEVEERKELCNIWLRKNCIWYAFEIWRRPSAAENELDLQNEKELEKTTRREVKNLN